ncbi:MAG: hypothetical protein ABWK00_02325 [Desulfurococcaceae archaeon]
MESSRGHADKELVRAAKLLGAVTLGGVGERFAAASSTILGSFLVLKLLSSALDPLRILNDVGMLSVIGLVGVALTAACVVKALRQVARLERAIAAFELALSGSAIARGMTPSIAWYPAALLPALIALMPETDAPAALALFASFGALSTFFLLVLITSLDNSLSLLARSLEAMGVDPPRPIGEGLGGLAMFSALSLGIATPLLAYRVSREAELLAAKSRRALTTVKSRLAGGLRLNSVLPK